MESELKKDIAELQKTINTVKEVRELFDPLDKPASNSSASTITVNAGGLGVYIAATCCAVMLAVNLFLIAIIVNHERKIDDLGDYIHAIYMVAPQLKPESKK